MARFLQSRSCNDDYFAENLNSNSNNNLNEAMSELIQQLEDINVANNKRKRPETKFYEFARALVNEGEMDADEAEMDNDYNDYCNYTDGYAYGYNYDEDAMIQEDDDDVQDNDEEPQDNELFQMKHELGADMVLGEAEVDEINEDFEELQQLRAENDELRENMRQQLIPFPIGSGIRFVTVDGIQYLQVFQESTPMSIDELNCDPNDDF